MRLWTALLGALVIGACTSPPPLPTHPLNVARNCVDPDGMEIGAQAGAESDKDDAHYYRHMNTRCGKKHISDESVAGGYEVGDGTLTLEHGIGVSEDHPRYIGERTSDFSISLGKEPGLTYDAGVSAENKKQSCFLCIVGYGGSIKINLGKGKR